MTPPFDGSMTVEVLHDDRSECTNAMPVLRYNIRCITGEVPTEATTKI